MNEWIWDRLTNFYDLSQERNQRWILFNNDDRNQESLRLEKTNLGFSWAAKIRHFTNQVIIFNARNELQDFIHQKHIYGCGSLKLLFHMTSHY